MSEMSNDKNRRILVIDDTESIHDDFRKILCADERDAAALDDQEAALFGETPPSTGAAPFELDSAYQGQEGLELIRRADREGRPYAMAFVDVRMPPGWDGIETIARIWQAYPDLQVVICTAYSDYSWHDVVKRLGETDRLLILKKPFDNVEVRQLTWALSEKWNLNRQVRGRLEALEDTVRARTRELEEQKRGLEQTVEQLKQAQLQLLQADKLASIGQLAAGVAHEVNNPIGFISSNLNSLREYVGDIKRVLAAYEDVVQAFIESDSCPAAKIDDVQRIRDDVDIAYITSDIDKLVAESIEGANRVRQIVADLRDFSHVDNPDVTEANINELLDKTVNVAWNELKYKADVVREYGDIRTIPCYGGKLAQVFLNLLLNAAQAIEEHGTITIRTGEEADMIWIEVSDTGQGIPAEHLDRIFDPFFTTKDVGAGTGLGLHLAYSIVAAHGGQISATSRVGQGTTLRIVLPIAGPPEAKDEQHECAA